jgi:glycosyltransferase involved in cell wall biosynthesis
MRVAIVTDTFPPEVNGVAMTLGRLVEGLRQRGHQVQLIRPRQGKDDVATTLADFAETLVAGLPLPRYPELHLGLPAGRRLFRLWAAEKPDIVHVVTEGPLGWSAVIAARRLGLPVSSGFHTNFDAYSRHYGFGWLKRPVTGYLRHFHNRTDATLVPTHALSRELAADGFRGLTVVARGVDTDLFNPARRSAYLRHRWGMQDEGLVVAYVGRLAPEKNLGLVLSAFDEIHRRRPDARLLFVGDGPSAGALARRHPKHLYAGTRRGEDLAAHYASADLFLFPSLTETYGNVTAEALASGLGVVAYAQAAAADLIDDGRNGRAVPAGDERSFIDAAVELATSPAQFAAVRRRAALSVALLDWELIHDHFAAVLVGLVASHERRRYAADCRVVLPD